MVRDKKLLERLGKMGFQLFESERAEDANRVLADVVKARDPRLWEGFPVVLANSASGGQFNYMVLNGYLTKPRDRTNLVSLTSMSLALYKTMRSRFVWFDDLYNLSAGENKKEYKYYLEMFASNGQFKVGELKMSAERVKTVFNNYTAKTGSGLGEFLAEKEELGLEYALSQVFSPTQKDLFLKKLKGDKFTKTEKEYFSRVVKKKVLALANSELHRLARKLLE